MALPTLRVGGRESPTDMLEKTRERQRELYQEELLRQMKEKEMEKKRLTEKKKQDQQQQLMMMMDYNPFGKSGGGAPNRDREGNLVAERTNLLVSLQHSSTSFPTLAELERKQEDIPSPVRKKESSPERPLRSWEDELFERKKREMERYQNDLEQQIQERNRRKAEEDRRRKDQELREERKLMMQREQLAQEHRRELRREKGQLPPQELKNRMVKNVPHGSVERAGGSIGHQEENMRFKSPTPPPDQMEIERNIQYKQAEKYNLLQKLPDSPAERLAEIRLKNYMQTMNADTLDLRRHLREQSDSFRGFISNMKEVSNQYKLNLSTARNDLQSVINRIKHEKEERERSQSLHPFMRFTSPQPYSAFQNDAPSTLLNPVSLISNLPTSSSILPTSSAYVSLNPSSVVGTGHSRTYSAHRSQPRTPLSQYGARVLEQSLPNLSQINKPSIPFEESPIFAQKSLYTDTTQIPLETRYSYHSSDYGDSASSPYVQSKAAPISSNFRFNSASKHLRGLRQDDQLSSVAADQLRNLDDILDELRDHPPLYVAPTSHPSTKTLLQSKRNYTEIQQIAEKPETIVEDKGPSPEELNRFQGSSGTPLQNKPEEDLNEREVTGTEEITEEIRQETEPK